LTKPEHRAIQNPLISNGFDSKSQVGVVSTKKDEILKQVKRRKGHREYGEEKCISLLDLWFSITFYWCGVCFNIFGLEMKEQKVGRWRRNKNDNEDWVLEWMNKFERKYLCMLTWLSLMFLVLMFWFISCVKLVILIQSIDEDEVFPDFPLYSRVPFHLPSSIHVWLTKSKLVFCKRDKHESHFWHFLKLDQNCYFCKLRGWIVYLNLKYTLTSFFNITNIPQK